MLYVKMEPYDEGGITLNITSESVFTDCPICGEEHPVDIVRLCRNPAFKLDSEIMCPECYAETVDVGELIIKENEK